MDYRRYLVFGLSFMLVVFAMAAGPLKERGQAVTGHELYKGMCASCHGENGEGQKTGAPGTRAPELANSTWLAMVDDNFLKTTIREGRHGSNMLAFPATQLNDERLTELVAFMRHEFGGGIKHATLPADVTLPASGNAANGQAYFTKNCVVCHGANGQGGVGLGLNNKGFIDSVMKNPEYLYLITNKGRVGSDPARAMPPLGAQPQDVADLLAFFSETWLPDAQIAQKNAENDAAALKKAIQQRSANLMIKPDAASDAASVSTSGNSDVAKAKALVSKNCFSCHIIGNEGTGNLGPNLSNVGSKYDVTKLTSIIKTGSHGTLMAPQAELSPAETQLVAEYLSSLK